MDGNFALGLGHVHENRHFLKAFQNYRKGRDSHLQSLEKDVDRTLFSIFRSFRSLGKRVIPDSRKIAAFVRV
jgi:hypothetical protein